MTPGVIIGLAMFLLLGMLLFKSTKYAMIGLGFYLLLAVFGLLAITPSITTISIGIGPVSSPPVQLLSLGLFILYAFLNFNSLVDYILGYQENKVARKTKAATKVNEDEDI